MAVSLLAALVVIVVSGCSGSVNEDLQATPTPYPLPSPGGASPAPEASPIPAVATALAAIEAGNAGRALVAAETAVATMPDDPELLRVRSRARLETGDREGAWADIERAIELAPERADLLVQRAELALRRGDPASALRDYDGAIAAEPGLVEAFVGRGRVQVSLATGDNARYGRALDDFNRALALDSGFVPARVARVEAYLDRFAFRGDPADLERAQREVDGIPDDELARIAFVRARLLVPAGDLAGARSAMAAAPLPSAGEAVSVAAERALADGEIAIAARAWQVAISAATTAVERSPWRREAYRALAEAQLGAGDAVAALATADRLLAVYPADGTGHFLRGRALQHLNRPDEAAAALAEAARRLATSPVYLARIEQLRRAAPELASPIS